MASDRSKSASKATKAAVKSSSQYDADAPLSANFSSSLSVVDYDHEAYLQLVSGSGPGLGNAGSSGAGVGELGKKTAAPKTANQVCREERTKHLTTRALDPAILEPRGDPSSVDFECAELQRKKDRFQ